jgi:hypothetical protein
MDEVKAVLSFHGSACLYGCCELAGNSAQEEVSVIRASRKSFMNKNAN